MARHCDRLFPANLEAAGELDPTIAAARLRDKYIVLGRKNERKRLASQLELKMRAIYYDVIDPAAVEGYIASIYQQVGRGGGGGLEHIGGSKYWRSPQNRRITLLVGVIWHSPFVFFPANDTAACMFVFPPAAV